MFNFEWCNIMFETECGNQVLTCGEKLSVRRHKHFKIYKYPHNWQNLAPYADFRNNQYDLCCFSEVDNGKERYLITSVY